MPYNGGRIEAGSAAKRAQRRGKQRGIRMHSNMKAAIFDMDGTLIDSMGAWRALNISFLREQGIEPTPQEEKTLYSMTGTMVVDYVKQRFGVDACFDDLLTRALERMEPVYQAGVPLKPGAAAYLKRLRARGVKTVVATATPARLALIALNRAGLVPELDYIYTTDIIGGHKGERAFFDKLCALIGERNEDCVMFEDGLYAMRGARSAGLGVIGITDPTNAAYRETMREVCDRVIDHYNELA